jgi:hypothetical protein
MNVKRVSVTPLKTFAYEGKLLPVKFVSTLEVANGVQCNVYEFVDDKNKDLGIIRIKPGGKTPLQKVLKGDKTIEGYISGKGKLTITKPSGKKQIYEVDDKVKKSIMVTVGISELMQWEADIESNLTVFEICYPPFEDGRYENIA